MVERFVKFDTLGSTFIPRIFADKDWTDLFGNFEDPIDELIKEFYSNARFIGVELQCWVRGMENRTTMLGSGNGVHHHPRLHCTASSYHPTCKCGQVSL